MTMVNAEQLASARETAKAWRIRPETAFADMAMALESAWNRYAVERSNDAFSDVARLVEFAITARDNA